MHRAKSVLLVLAASTGPLAAPALGQPAATPAVPPPAVGSAPVVGATTDRLIPDGWQVGLDAGLILLDEGVDATGLRLDLFGQYLAPVGAGRIGGYAVAPFAALVGEDESGSAVGNLELGALYASALTPQISFIGRAGVALPTTEDDFEALTINFISGVGRLTDLFTQIPDTTTVRLGASSTLRSGQFLGRFDLGVDIPRSSGDIGDVGIDAVVRVNAAAGLDLRTMAFLAELASVTEIGDGDGDDDDSFQTLAFTLQVTSGRHRPFVSMIVPLDEGLQQAVSLVLAVGFRTGP